RHTRSDRDWSSDVCSSDLYARDPVVQNLVASPRLDATHWRSISWRDSNAGYANGRFEMDINAIWAPRALESISQIVTALHTAGRSEERRVGKECRSRLAVG